MRLTPHHTEDPTYRDPPTGQPAQQLGGRRPPWRRALLATAVVAAAVVALTASPAQAADGVRVVALVASVDQVLTNLRNWLMGILAGLATVFLTVGGVRYLMAGGDPGEVERAKTAFKSAGWGYVGAALAPLIVAVLKGLVGA